MSTELMFALVCALAGIGYGVVSIMSILNKPAGDDEMQRIQSAIQEGASAYRCNLFWSGRLHWHARIGALQCTNC